MQNKPTRDPQTQAAHRRETRLQIILPLLLGVLAVLGLAIWTGLVASRGGNVSQAADTSLIFLLIPMLVLALIVVALLGGLIYLMVVIIDALPPKFYVLQGFFLAAQKWLQDASDKLTEPALRTKSAAAAWRTLRKAFVAPLSNKTIPREGP
jgi:hypothetical protein